MTPPPEKVKVEQGVAPQGLVDSLSSLAVIEVRLVLNVLLLQPPPLLTVQTVVSTAALSKEARKSAVCVDRQVQWGGTMRSEEKMRMGRRETEKRRAVLQSRGATYSCLPSSRPR